MNYSSLYRTTTTTTTVAKHKVTQHVRQDTNEYVIKRVVWRNTLYKDISL